GAPRLRPGRQHQNGGDGRRRGQRPGDRLPAPEPPREGGPLGIAEAAQQDRRDHQQVAGHRSAAAMMEREARHRRGADRGKDPEDAPWSLAAPQNPEDRGGQRQQADEHHRMRRSDMLEREPGQEGEADDHADRDNDQGHEVAARRHILTQPQQEDAPQQRRYG
ncbi:hypothetical protein QU38_02225, partial [Staphylococcus aureus]